MSTVAPRTYRFATPPQWQTCLTHRLEPAANGGLAPALRLGRHVVSLTEQAATAVAVDAHGNALWRTSAPGGGAALQRFDDLGGIGAPLPIAGALATATRWIADRHSLWAFAAPARIERYEADVLERDLVIDIDVESNAIEAAAEVARPLRILDIAGDSHQGLWVMAHAADERAWLVHVDCHGCVRTSLPVPCGVMQAAQIATVSRGHTLVLLTAGGTRLALVDADTARLGRTVSLKVLEPCFAAERIAADGRDRVVVFGTLTQRGGPLPALLVLDGNGELLDGPLTEVLDILGARAPKVTDVAIRGDVAWLATSCGLARLDASEACGPRETESVLLTPVLDSPPSSAGRGWLRAELDIELPRGALLETWFAATDDARIADEIRDIAADRSRTALQRHAAIAQRVEALPAQRHAFTGPTEPGVALAVPLFDAHERWLWLGLRLVVAPGVAAPEVSELRMRYPEMSLMNRLPGIFQGEPNDPGLVMRRLVGVIETTTQGLDEGIRAIGTHIDPVTAPPEWLDYLGRWLGVPWDDALDVAVKRAVLRAAGELMRKRGTRAGLKLLLDCLLGAGAAILTDVTVDHAVARLRTPDGRGARLPLLLGGVSPALARLSGKAVLGHTRLACGPTPCDPLESITPTVRILVTTTRATRAGLEPLLPALLAQYVPADLHLVLRWRTTPELPRDSEEQGMVLDALGRGALGTDGVLGRTLLAGTAPGRLDAAGVDVGFRLH